MGQLLSEPFIMREPGSGTRKSIEQAMEKSGTWLVQQNVIAEMGSTEAIRQAIKAGVGISILSGYAVADDIAAGTLAKVKIAGISLRRSFFLIMHKHRTQSPLCRAFVEFLNQAYKGKKS
jgi:DNA-binding transcriptional LysR family regulator